MKKYIPNQIEPKWQEKWKEDGLFSPDLDKAEKPYYSLMMFPYPSAEGLHVGNAYAFIGSDIFSRFKRMQGYDVFEPIGLDGFGIHGENYALKINEHPSVVSKRTEAHFYEQFKVIGNAYDFKRTVDTYKPEYYKWTQWAFLQLYKKGLAYRKKAEVNWCTSCLTVLADEQVISGECERCSTKVIKKELEQWFFKITDYTERLLANLEWIDWSEKVKVAQRNWIGKSEGVLIKFDSLEVFTTRPDTLFGVSFIVISPEHPLLNSFVEAKQQQEVAQYLENAKKKSEAERKGNKEKVGIFTGTYVKHPLTGEKIPVWISDYVLMGYGTGVVMGVPAHDPRDFEFAQKYNLSIPQVIISSDSNEALPYEGEGILMDSGEFTGLSSDRAKADITNYLEQHQLGQKLVQYHLRDWLISRQRYWGPPIPIIYCDKCGIVPVPEEDLPVELPYIENFRPTGSGQSPLASDPAFVNVKCPKCGGKGKRETDVSDNFLDSALYFFRYLTTDFDDKFFDKNRTKKWLPVDMYIGGAEHSVLHLLYSRFITMVFKDLGLIDFEEPFEKFRAHGLIIKEGAKMSKSKGNVVNPDQYIKEWGADTLRLYLMFIGAFSEGGDFRDTAIVGTYHFLERVWSLFDKMKEIEIGKEDLVMLNKTIKKVGEDIESLKYNTAIASLMEWLNYLSRKEKVNKEEYEVLLKLLAPFAPHMVEELFQMILADQNQWKSIHQQPWPKYEEKYLEEEEVTVVIQVNGKLRDQVVISKDIASDSKVVEEKAKESVKIQKYLEGKEIKKVVYIPMKIINFVLAS